MEEWYIRNERRIVKYLEKASDPLRTFRNEKMNTRVYIYKTKTLVTYTYTYTSVRTTLVSLILKRRERE